MLAFKGKKTSILFRVWAVDGRIYATFVDHSFELLVHEMATKPGIMALEAAPKTDPQHVAVLPFTSVILMAWVPVSSTDTRDSRKLHLQQLEALIEACIVASHTGRQRKGDGLQPWLFTAEHLQFDPNSPYAQLDNIRNFLQKKASTAQSVIGRVPGVFETGDDADVCKLGREAAGGLLQPDEREAMCIYLEKARLFTQRCMAKYLETGDAGAIDSSMKHLESIMDLQLEMDIL